MSTVNEMELTVVVCDKQYENLEDAEENSVHIKHCIGLTDAVKELDEIIDNDEYEGFVGVYENEEEELFFGFALNDGE